MEAFNKIKRKYDMLKILGFVLVVIGTFIGYIIFRPSGRGVTDLVFMACALPGIGLIVHANNNIKTLSRVYKKRYIKNEIESRIPGSVYEMRKGVTPELVHQSELVELEDIFESEDLIYGEIEGVQFQCSDVTIQKEVKRNHNERRIVTTFQGRIFEFDFNKEFRSDVRVMKKHQEMFDRSYKQVEMESVAFNKGYNVYAKSEHDAFYILTPPIVEKLVMLDEKYPQGFKMSFKYKKLYISVSGVDSFDVLRHGNINEDDLKKGIGEIESIIDFVDFLQLHKDIFKVE